MTDYIKREDAINKFIKMSAGNVLDDHVLALKEIQAADVVEVVRCKDCKYYEDGLCANIDFLTVKPEDFCSYAEGIENGG